MAKFTYFRAVDIPIFAPWNAQSAGPAARAHARAWDSWPKPAAATPS